MKKAMIAMSGGVDSSVAAYLITQQGYEAIGVTMKLYNNEDIGIKKEKTCCSLDDVEDARSVANRLGIPYYVFNYTDNFKLQVIERFVEAYRNGRTPNPCIDCNRYIKFDQLMHRAKELQFDYVVTGHYAINEYDEEKGRWILHKATDDTKDQSYVLYSLTQDQLSRILFPLGRMTKHEAREIAEAQGFVNADKHDSQDICFVPDGDYAHFIENWCGFRFTEGDFVDHDGNFIAKHKGIINYTIGQRKGLGIAAEEPLYVIALDAEKNQVIVGNNSQVFAKGLIADKLNWVAIDNLREPMEAKVKIRYGAREAAATLYPQEDGKVKVEFREPARAITPGQSAVFYIDQRVLGGGIIEGGF